MIDPARAVLGQARLITALLAVFVLAGAAAYLQMNRQENPSFPYRAAIITVAFPGADPERMERLVGWPLEEELAEIAEIREIETTLRQGIAVVRLELDDQVYDTDSAWDRVRVAMDSAAREYPDGVHEARLDDRIIDSSLMVLAVTGDGSPRALAEGAKKLRRHLLGVDGVASTRLFGDPGQQITIAIDDAAIARYGLTPRRIARDLRASNQVTSGGTLRVAGASVSLDPAIDYADITAIRETAIGLPGGQTLPLAALADVYESAAMPPEDELWYDGERGVGLEIIAARGINVVALGERLRTALEHIRPALAPLTVHEMFYQPAQTEDRLSDLSLNLLISITIILGVLFLLMGWRMGVVVALLLPLVTLTTLALYAVGGGILQQVAIIGLVVALGILVDNAIVMTENVQWRLNGNEGAADAVAGSITELAGPLFAATGTTLAAFVPMLLATGNTADFTRALPIMLMLSLSVSYLFAITVTPLLAKRLLRAQPGAAHGRLNALGDVLARLTMNAPITLIVLGALAIGGALAAQPLLDQEFFPAADRNTVVIDLQLPEGTHQSRTADAARQLQQALRSRAGVEAIHGFIGTGGPVFFYNLQQAPEAPQLARLVVITDRLSRNQPIIDYVADYSHTHLPGAVVVARKLSQGPVTDAPIELRVFNADPALQNEATRQLFEATLTLPGARDVRHDLGTGVPSLDFTVEQAVARRHGVTPIDVADALRGRSHGLIAGEYRGARDPMPIRLRSPEGERFDPTDLQTINVYAENGDPVPLMQVASARLSLAPGAIRHYNQRRVTHVYSELDVGAVYSEVLEPLKARIAELDLPPGTRIEYGGNAEESGKANQALFRAAPLGLAMLLFFLLIQFNSFKRLLLVLLTAPFALGGVIPGLLLLGIPFGFMPLLGVIALTGIVVNNAIVLIDVIDQRLAAGAELPDAIAEAVRRRTRPIILTTATTIAGLLPLAFSSATLWPPMAWPIITGLLASTVLTLLVLPAVCRFALRGQGPRPGRMPVAVLAAAAILAALPATPGHAQAADPAGVTFAETLRMARQRALVEVDRHEAKAVAASADRARRSARYPTVSASAFVSRSDNVPELHSDDFAEAFPADQPLPDLSIPVGERDRRGATIELRQPVLDLAAQLYGAPAAGERARAARSALDRTLLTSMVQASEAYVAALSVRARQRANLALIDNLFARFERVTALETSGRALASDVLEVRYALEQARQQQSAYAQNYAVAQMRLGRALGQDSPRAPDRLAYRTPAVARTAEALVDEALRQRRDLAALESRIRAAALRTREARAQRLPTLDAVASLNYNEGNAFAPEREGRIAAQVTWRPFAGGTISAQREAAAARLAGLRAQRSELVRNISVEVRQAFADLRNARRRQKLARLGIESAQARRDTRSARLEAGRANIDDVLDAEATLAQRKAQAQIAHYEIVAAWVRLQGATGAEESLTRIARF